MNYSSWNLRTTTVLVSLLAFYCFRNPIKIESAKFLFKLLGQHVKKLGPSPLDECYESDDKSSRTQTSRKRFVGTGADERYSKNDVEHVDEEKLGCIQVFISRINALESLQSSRTGINDKIELVRKLTAEGRVFTSDLLPSENPRKPNYRAGLQSWD